MKELTDQQEQIIFASLDMAEGDAQSQLYINFQVDDMTEFMPRDDVKVHVQDSLYFEIVRAKIALMGEYVFDFDNQRRVTFTDIDEALDNIADDYYYHIRCDISERK